MGSRQYSAGDSKQAVLGAAQQEARITQRWAGRGTEWAIEQQLALRWGQRQSVDGQGIECAGGASPLLQASKEPTRHAPPSHSVRRIAAQVCRAQQGCLSICQPRPAAAQLGKRCRTLPQCRAPPARGGELGQRAEALRQRGSDATVAVQVGAIATGAGAGFGAAPLEHQVLYEHLPKEQE